ncbi:MAG TPA: hypothetical protein VJS19_06630 [Candidatus Dormibacteraeota bacterium]|nr:hypothetical protein [Candidatus Dormibacteraeota bacterium]
MKLSAVWSVTPKIAHHASWIGEKNGWKMSNGELRKMMRPSCHGTGS